MPRAYTTPIEIPDETKAQVMQFGMTIDLSDAGNPSANSFFSYVVNKYNSDGKAVKSVTQAILWTDIPAIGKTQIRQLHALVLQHAQASGIIAAGTDDNDL